MTARQQIRLSNDGGIHSKLETSNSDVLTLDDCRSDALRLAISGDFQCSMPLEQLFDWFGEVR